MEEETEKATETEQQITEEQPVTDAELDSALETEPKEPEVIESLTPTKSIEPEEHKDRTRLGWKVAKLEKNVNKIVETIEQFINEQRLAQMEKRSFSNEPEPEETIVSTSKDVQEIVRREILREKTQTMQSEEKYQIGYVRQLMDLKSKEPQLYDDIEKEMMNNFNKRHFKDHKGHYSNPDYDCIVNYNQAKASVLAKKVSTTKPRIPVADETPEAPTALASSTRVKISETPMPKLSEEAQKLADYCRKQGMTEAEIKEALSAEMPLGLEPPILTSK